MSYVKTREQYNLNWRFLSPYRQKGGIQYQLRADSYRKLLACTNLAFPPTVPQAFENSPDASKLRLIAFTNERRYVHPNPQPNYGSTAPYWLLTGQPQAASTAYRYPLGSPAHADQSLLLAYHDWLHTYRWSKKFGSSIGYWCMVFSLLLIAILLYCFWPRWIA